MASFQRHQVQQQQQQQLKQPQQLQSKPNVSCISCLCRTVFGRSRVFKSVLFCSLLLIAIHYFILSPRSDQRSSLTDLDGGRYHARIPQRFNHTVGRYHARIPARFNYTVGLVWPSTDVGSPPVDRLQNQMTQMNNYAESKRKRDLKIIVRVGDFNFENWLGGQEQFRRDRCPVVDCWLSTDVTQARTADALLISEFSYSWRSDYLPKSSSQIWIAQHWESPMHDRIDTAAVKDLINWTVSYRRDSTIPISYSRFYPIVGASTPSSNVTTKNYAAGKTRKVAWFVSNCQAKNHRLRYAKELSKHIQVDVYGTCGRLKCPRTDEESCLQLLSRRYKFYLAFENSNCDDYITEKLSYTALGHDVIPIVMGARQEDYASFAPTHSYIHVDDFTGPQQLADYLHLLDRNDTLYNEYFTWKGSWMNIDQRYWCRLCALLHWRDDVDYVSWYDDYRAWWNGACDRSPTLSWFQRNSAPTETVNDGSPDLHISSSSSRPAALDFTTSAATTNTET